MESEQGRNYIAIDLKSFYASVECRERDLDPLSAHLVVADVSRTEKTICLAVSPSLKACGIPGRPRLFEVLQRVKEVNRQRLSQAIQNRLLERGADHQYHFTGKSADASALAADPTLALDFIIAPPQMKKYEQYSASIYSIYLKYVAPEDIHVYSIDEVFMDVTHYLKNYHMTSRQLTEVILKDVLDTTGITATAGIGTNLYLSKIAMDIVAKHISPDKNGARIAELDEMSYRRQLWSHRPLTDFWRVGRGYAKRLEKAGLCTMGDIARCSVGKPNEYYNEDLLYKMFGVNAELLIDHAWGWEPVTISQIKAYRPENNSISSGQVLSCPYDTQKGEIIVREMTELLVLDLVDKGFFTNQMVLTIGYDRESLEGERGEKYRGEVTRDRYGRLVPKHAHGTANLPEYTSSTRKILAAVIDLYHRIINPDLLIRRVNITACRVLPENQLPDQSFEQLDLFTDYEALEKKKQEEKETDEKEKSLQKAMLSIQKRYGKNAILKGTNLQEGATTLERNQQIGGHKA